MPDRITLDYMAQTVQDANLVLVVLDRFLRERPENGVVRDHVERSRLVKEFTMDDLSAVLDSTAGSTHNDPLTDDLLDVEMVELGYDSLVIYEVVTILQDQLSIPISDEEAGQLDTPRAFITLVNERLAEHSAR